MKKYSQSLPAQRLVITSMWDSGFDCSSAHRYRVRVMAHDNTWCDVACSVCKQVQEQLHWNGFCRLPLGRQDIIVGHSNPMAYSFGQSSKMCWWKGDRALGQGQGKQNQGAGIRGSPLRKETLPDFGVIQTQWQSEAFFLLTAFSILKSQFST